MSECGSITEASEKTLRSVKDKLPIYKGLIPLIKDSGPNHNDLIGTGSPPFLFVPSPWGTGLAVDFDPEVLNLGDILKSYQRSLYSDSTDFVLDQPFTIEYKCQFHANASDTILIIRGYNDNDSLYGIGFTGAKVYFWLYDSGAVKRSVIQTATNNIDDLIDIKAEWTGAQLKLTVNSILETPVACTSVLTGHTPGYPVRTRMSLGNNTALDSTYPANSPFTGLIEDVKITKNSVVVGEYHFEERGNIVDNATNTEQLNQSAILKAIKENQINDTQKTIIHTPAKGFTPAGDITSEAVDANTQAIHVWLKNALTISGTVDENIASVGGIPQTPADWTPLFQKLLNLDINLTAQANLIKGSNTITDLLNELKLQKFINFVLWEDDGTTGSPVEPPIFYREERVYSEDTQTTTVTYIRLSDNTVQSLPASAYPISGNDNRKLEFFRYIAIGASTGISVNDLLANSIVFNTVTNKVLSNTWYNLTTSAAVSAPSGANIKELLPNNAAQETGGNLTAILAILGNGNQITQINKGIIPAATIMQNAATGNGNGTNLACDGYNSAIISITASVAMSGGTTINFEASVDNTTWVAISAHQVGTTTLAQSTTTTGDFRLNVSGYSFIRARISAYSAGTITVKGYVVVGTGLPNTVNILQSNADLNKTDANLQVGDTDVSSSNPVPVSSTPATPTVSSTLAPTQFKNLGANATLNVKASAGNVFSLSCINANLLVRFLQLHNTATTPAGGAAPLYTFPVPPNSSGIVIGTDFFTVAGAYFSTGIAFAFSTTKDTYTAGAAGDQTTIIHYV